MKSPASKKQKKYTSKKPIPTENSIPQIDFLDTLNVFFKKFASLFFWLGLGMTILFSLLLFDLKVSDGGDDSSYIVRAYEFIENGVFPTYQGPLYPMMLSVIVLFFGVKVGLLKLFSLIAISAQYYFLHKTFKNRIPEAILYPVLLIISVSSSIFYFSSQTYSEGFFMFLQSLFLFLFVTYFIDKKIQLEPLKIQIKGYLFVALAVFSLIWTRNVGLAVVIAIGLYFISYFEWKKLLLSAGSIIAVLLPFELFKKLIFKVEGVQFGTQADGLLLKNFYNPAQGYEDFAGLIQRFIENSHLYFSKHLFVFMGFKQDDFPQISPNLTWLIYAICLVALIFAYQRNKTLFFTILYTGVISVVTFFAVQSHWDQPRLIIPLYPLLLIALLSGFYFLLKLEKAKRFQILFLILIFVIFGASFKRTLTKVQEHAPNLQASLSGNMFYGMTPDWVNYIKMSEWIAKNIPEEEMVAARKPEISFVYSGRGFYGVYNVPTMNPDTFIASLTANPEMKVVAVNLMQISENPQLQIFQSISAPYLHASLNASLLSEDYRVLDSRVLGVYLVPVSVLDSMMMLGNSLGIEFVDEIPSLVHHFLSENWQFAIHNPDEMLNELKRENVRYFMLASLRKNPDINNGEIITTLHRYIYFIQLKYPNIYEQVHSIGVTEPTTLIKLNLQKY
ncbi:MAG: hypothetical protein RBS19_03865 [Bacteroidales bacterium]|nr:hypothetical protein [Bacteroidales bacterium]MDY0216077.1 hypothetical protein [Bacteroidales bacterium]